MAQAKGLPSADSSIFSGGLAGVLAGSVFGGPVGAAVGLATGLISDRMRKSELDLLADDYDAINTYGSDIQEKIKTTSDYLHQVDPTDVGVKQIESVAEDAARAQKLSTHYDPQLRVAGLQQLTSIGERIDAIQKGVGERTQQLADEQTKAQREAGQHYQTIIETNQDKARELNARADFAMQLVQADTEISKPETKTAIMQLMNMQQREADQDAGSFSLGFLGTGISMDINDFNPSYSDALKIIEGTRSTMLKSINDYVAQTVQHAQQNGFTFTADPNGKVEAHSINTVIQQFQQLPALATPPTPSPSLPTQAVDAAKNAASTAGDVLSRTDLTQPGYTGSLLMKGAEKVKGAAESGLQEIENFAKDKADAAAKLLHRLTNRTKQREVNR